MKQTVIVAGIQLTLEAVEGELSVNGVPALHRELRALEEASHHVRIAADLQRSAIRRRALRSAGEGQ